MRTPSLAVLSTLALALAAAACSSCSADEARSSPPAAAGLSPENQRVWDDARAHDGLGALDGRAFAIEVGEQGKPAEQHEVIEFAGGRFHSRACDEYGFGTGPYAIERDGDVLAYRATCTNGEGSENRWHGRVHGDEIEGGFTWTPPGKSPVEFWFRGRATRP